MHLVMDLVNLIHGMSDRVSIYLFLYIPFGLCVSPFYIVCSYSKLGVTVILYYSDYNEILTLKQQ